MKLSKFSKAVYDITPLPATLCQIVGQFANRDVYQKRGDKYFTMECVGKTFFRDQYNRLIPVGENRIIHMFLVEKTTPCSLVTSYIKSLIVAHGFYNDIYKYVVNLATPTTQQKRFFPTRSQAHKQHYFFKYVDLDFYEIPPSTAICQVGKNFILG